MEMSSVMIPRIPHLLLLRVLVPSGELLNCDLNVRDKLSIKRAMEANKASLTKGMCSALDW